jgi:hypothetical protein
LGLAGWDAFLGMQRFTKSEDEKLNSSFVVAKTLIDDGSLMLTWNEAQGLISGEEFIPVKSLERAQEIERGLFEDAVDTAFRSLRKNADTVIIESFNDSVWPWEGLDHVDKALVVGPGQIFVYEPEKVRKAAFLTHRGNAPIREVTFSRIADLILPRERYQLKPEVGLSDADIRKILSASPKDMTREESSKT